MEYCPNKFQTDRSVHLIEREWDEYGIRTEPPYMPSYAYAIGRHSDPYPTISDQAYSRWRIGWL